MSIVNIKDNLNGDEYGQAKKYTNEKNSDTDYDSKTHDLEINNNGPLQKSEKGQEDSKDYYHSYEYEPILSYDIDLSINETQENASHKGYDIKDDTDISEGLILDETSETPFTPSVELISGNISNNSYNENAQYEMLDAHNEEMKEDNVSQFEENNGVRILNGELAEIKVIQEFREALQSVASTKVISPVQAFDAPKQKEKTILGTNVLSLIHI